MSVREENSMRKIGKLWGGKLKKVKSSSNQNAVFMQASSSIT
jgi:hypothetical protein